MHEGRTPLDAALLSARELAGPIIAMTITLAAVYTPIALQGGLTGSLFREFAFTLAGAVLISGVVALTLSPMMSASLLRASDQEAFFPKLITRTFDRVKHGYSRLLGGTLSARPAVYTVWVVLTLLIIPMFMFAPKELAPTEDQGVIFAPILDAPANATIDQTVRYSDKANDLLMSTPEAEHTFQVSQPNTGFSGLMVKPWKERKRTVSKILPEVQRKIHALTGITMFPLLPPALPGGGNFPLEFVVSSTADQRKILEYAQQLRKVALESGKFMMLQIDTKIDQPEAQLVLDREKIAMMGLSLSQIGADLSAAVGGNYVNRFSIDGRSYKVIAPSSSAGSRMTPEQVEDLHVTGPNGQLIPLSSIAHHEIKATPRSLNRFQQLNAVKLSGVSMLPLDEALKFLEDESAGLLRPRVTWWTTRANRASCDSKATASSGRSAWRSC